MRALAVRRTARLDLGARELLHARRPRRRRRDRSQPLARRHHGHSRAPSGRAPSTRAGNASARRPGACASPADWPARGLARRAGARHGGERAWRAAGRLDARPSAAVCLRRSLVSPEPHPLTGSGPQRLASARPRHARRSLARRRQAARLGFDVRRARSRDRTDGSATLALCFRSLTPVLAANRSRARWRPRLVAPPTLRNVRTTLLGHMPGWCPPVQAVGPWRPIELLGDARTHSIRSTSRADSTATTASCRSRYVSCIRRRDDVPAVIELRRCPFRLLQWRDACTLTGSLRVPRRRTLVAAYAWRAHFISIDCCSLNGGPATFEHWARSASAASKWIAARTVTGFALRVNDAPVFCRGACWTSADLVTLTGTRRNCATPSRSLAMPA